MAKSNLENFLSSFGKDDEQNQNEKTIDNSGFLFSNKEENIEKYEVFSQKEKETIEETQKRVLKINNIQKNETKDSDIENFDVSLNNTSNFDEQVYYDLLSTIEKSKDEQKDKKDQYTENLESKEEIIVNNSNEIDEKEEIEILWKKSESDLKFKEKWFSLYEKAQKSDKKTLTNDKVKRGKFRITEEGNIEILPDLDTYGKDSKQLLEIKWF